MGRIDLVWLEWDLFEEHNWKVSELELVYDQWYSVSIRVYINFLNCVEL